MTKELDLRGLRCPLPVLRTRKALRAMAPGDAIVVASSDPLAGIDIPHLLAETGDILEDVQHVDGDVLFRIRRKA